VLIRSATASVVAVLLLAAGCGGAGSTPSPGGTETAAPAPGGQVRPPAGKAALEITTQIGEQCPHRPLTSDPRCDPRPRPDTGFVVRSEAGEVVAEGRSDGDGRAAVFVTAGTYVVRGEPVAGYQFTPERRVTVGVGANVAVPLTYTTGIQ
jgi:hypothetical protein